MQPLHPLILVYVFISFLNVNAQNKVIVDSLYRLIANPATSDTTLVKAYNDLGIQFATSNPTKAKILIKKSLVLSQKMEAPRGIAGANNCLGVVYYYQKKYDSALICFKKALQINKQIGHSWGQASALHQMGATQNLLSKHGEAITSFKKAGSIFLRLNDSLSYIKSIENTGVSYNLIKHSKKALEHFISANHLYEKHNNIPGISRTNIHISNTLIQQKEYAKALEYLNTYFPIVEKGGNKIHLNNTLKNIGICYKGLRDYDQALLYFQKSLNLWQKADNFKRIASIQSLFGDTYYEMNLYSKALLYQKKALNNYSKKGDLGDKTVTNNSIAKSYLKLKQLDSAKVYAENSIAIAKRSQNIKGEKEANQTLALIAEQEGNSTDAYMYYKNISILKDSLDIIQKKEQFRELQAKYETDKKEKRINELAQINKQTKQQYALHIMTLGVGVILLGIGIYRFRKKFRLSCIEKKLLRKELDTKKRELTTNSLYLAKKNRVLENIKEEVEHIRYSEDQNKQYNYQKLIRTINFDMKEDNDWENFKKYFEQVHNDFYGTIKSQYPEVTANELRLMALLKMNLSSKEIARILNITQEGVRKARYRLRKKLNIGSNNRLMDLILSTS